MPFLDLLYMADVTQQPKQHDSASTVQQLFQARCFFGGYGWELSSTPLGMMLVVMTHCQMMSYLILAATLKLLGTFVITLTRLACQHLVVIFSGGQSEVRCVFFLSKSLTHVTSEISESL